VANLDRSLWLNWFSKTL